MTLIQKLLALIFGITVASAATYRLGYYDFIEGVAVNRNFIANGEFEKSQAGATSYEDDTSLAYPVDGTSGTAAIISCDHTGSAINGSGSLLISKTGADSRGEGCSIPITLDSGMKYSTVAIAFDYIIGSGTFTAGSLSTSSDLEVFVYDVTNLVLIPVDFNRLESNSSTVPFAFYGTFPASSSTSYRLIFHSTSTDTDAWTIKLDSIKVSKQATAQGPPLTDWTAYTPTLNSSTSVNLNTAQWRRVGDTMEIFGRITYNGAGNNSIFTVDIPSGYAIDSTKFPVSSVYTYGYGLWFDTGTDWNSFTVDPFDTNTFYFHLDQSTSDLNSSLFANGDSVTYNMRFPVTGWASNVAMSSIDSTREVIEHYSTDTATSIANGSSTTVPLEDLIESTHGALATATGIFTAPVSGTYTVTASMVLTNGGGWGAGEQISLDIFKNGVSQRFFSSSFAMAAHTTYMSVSGATSINLKAGDTAQVKVFQNSGGAINLLSATGYNEVRFHKAGPKQRVAAQEPVIAIYSITASSANLSIADNAEERLDYNNKIKDSHNAVTTGASWTFTAPYSATYEFCAAMWWNTTTNITTTYIRARVNSSVVYYMRYGHASDSEHMYGCYMAPLLAGATFDVVVLQDDSAGAAHVIYDSGAPRIQIKSVGPY